MELWGSHTTEMMATDVQLSICAFKCLNGFGIAVKVCRLPITPSQYLPHSIRSTDADLLLSHLRWYCRCVCVGRTNTFLTRDTARIPGVILTGEVIPEIKTNPLLSKMVCLHSWRNDEERDIQDNRCLVSRLYHLLHSVASVSLAWLF